MLPNFYIMYNWPRLRPFNNEGGGSAVLWPYKGMGFLQINMTSIIYETGIMLCYAFLI